MALYEFVCNQCGRVANTFIATDRVVQGETPDCSVCSLPMTRIFSLPAVQVTPTADDVLNDAAAGAREAPGMTREETIKAARQLAESQKQGRKTSEGYRRPDIRKPGKPIKVYT